MTSLAVEIEKLTVSYHGVPALKNVNLTVRPGTMTAIIGPNGAGKSTLLSSILGLLTPDHGTVSFFGQSLDRMRKELAYVPQRSTVDWTFPISVLGTALLGTYPRLGLMKRPRAAHRILALESLERLGIADLADHQIGTLSGGQQQRMFLARALTQQAKLIILDEPFIGVDATSEKLIVELLHELRDQGITILVVHHDIETVPKYYDQAILLNKTIVAQGPVAEVVTQELLTLAYHPELKIPVLIPGVNP